MALDLKKVVRVLVLALGLGAALVQDVIDFGQEIGIYDRLRSTVVTDVVGRLGEANFVE